MNFRIKSILKNKIKSTCQVPERGFTTVDVFKGSKSSKVRGSLVIGHCLCSSIYFSIRDFSNRRPLFFDTTGSSGVAPDTASIQFPPPPPPQKKREIKFVTAVLGLPVIIFCESGVFQKISQSQIEKKKDRHIKRLT